MRRHTGSIRTNRAILRNCRTRFTPDFLEVCNCQQDLADELFEGVDWQHPESLKEDWFVNGEWVECEGCGKIINYGDGCNDTKCPNCGRKVKVD